jgi:hypothetical protein
MTVPKRLAILNRPVSEGMFAIIQPDNLMSGVVEEGEVVFAEPIIGGTWLASGLCVLALDGVPLVRQVSPSEKSELLEVSVLENGNLTHAFTLTPNHLGRNVVVCGRVMGILGAPRPETFLSRRTKQLDVPQSNPSR